MRDDDEGAVDEYGRPLPGTSNNAASYVPACSEAGCRWFHRFVDKGGVRQQCCAHPSLDAVVRVSWTAAANPPPWCPLTAERAQAGKAQGRRLKLCGLCGVRYPASEEKPAHKARCGSCAHFLEAWGKGAIVTLTGRTMTAYLLGSGGGGGFGGRGVTIYFDDGRVTKSNDLWCVGDVPYALHAVFRPNARLEWDR